MKKKAMRKLVHKASETARRGKMMLPYNIQTNYLHFLNLPNKGNKSTVTLLRGTLYYHWTLPPNYGGLKV